MAIILKKIIAVLSSLAISASVMPMALAAATPDADGVYYDEDFSDFSSGKLVDLATTKNDTYSDGYGMTFSCRGRSNDTIQQGINITNDGAIYLFANKYVDQKEIQPTITLDWTKGATFENDRVMSFDIKGAVGTEVVVTDSANAALTIVLPSANTLNCNIYSKTDDATYIIIYDSLTGDLVKADTSATVLTDFATITSTRAKTFSYTLDNLKIQDTSITVPVIELEDVNRIEIGVQTKIAEVTGTENITANADNDAFTTTVENGAVYVTAQEGTESGTSATVTIDAKTEISLSKSITLTAQTAQEIADAVAEEIDISCDSVTDNGNGTYTVVGGFKVPVSDGLADIQWKSDTSSVSIDDRGNVSVAASASGTVTLTATVTYNGAETSREFTLIIPSNKVFYDLDFNAAATGNLASIDGPGTGEYNGLTANVVTRSGSNNCNYVSVANSASISDSNYLAIVSSNYNVSDSGANNSRRTYITLSKMNDITIANTLHINFDVRFGKTTSSIVLTDGLNSIPINADMASEYGELPVDTWYNVNIDSNPSEKTCFITVKDAEGNKLAKYSSTSILKTLTTINTDGGNDIYFYIDNFFVADAIVPVVTQTTDTVLLGTTDTVAKISDATDVKVEISDEDAFSIAYEDGNVMVTSKGAQRSSATVTVTAENEGIVVKEIFDITAPAADDIIDAAKAQNTVYFASDPKGAAIKPELTDGAVIYNDLVLPSKEKVTIDGFTHTADVKWKVTSGNTYLSDDGVISVPDKNAHAVTLQKTVSYSKNGTVQAKEDISYNLSVQFEPDSVLSKVNAAVDALEDMDDAKKADLKQTLTDAAVHAYKVRFDAAYQGNFTGIESPAKGNFTLKTKGEFGSDITWSSSIPTVIKSTGELIRPTTARKVDLTATVMSGSASQQVVFPIYVEGTRASSGSSGGGGGGGVASSTGTINKGTSSSTISTNTSTATIPASINNAADTVSRLQEEALAANDLFKDIVQATWARDAINGLAAKGVINGKSDTEFAPNDTVTRAEFAKMLMGAFGLASDAYTTSSFRDVPTGEWYFQFVESAYNLGIIQGTGNGTFEPNALITRQDMAVMVARAALIAGRDLTAVREMLGFADGGSIASYATEAVEQLVKAGAMSGKSDTEFAPRENATRAQAAQILFNLVG